ncbi:MAG: YraN family protein [Desulfobacteraceae bacterium]|nr:YraN family protein [Desulfobacteraceae bacterium]
MKNHRQEFGKSSEEIATRFLKKKGYKILERNYRTRIGEIDIIARDKQTIAFVEVKARKSNQYGNPKWAVTPKKQKTISMVALQYLKSSNRIDSKARFDVVSIQSLDQAPEIELIRNAFDLAYG